MSKLSEALLARALEIIEAERLYEIEMNARIISESALIRAEWSAEEEWKRRVQKCGPTRFVTIMDITPAFDPRE
jgi:hypothetical protein